MESKYGVIYADPPWKFATYSDKGKGRSAEAWYDCLSIEEIKSLPVESLAAKDCVLLMWVTDPFVFQAESVMRAWGFKPKTIGFYWVKTGYAYRNQEGFGTIRSEIYPIGTGYWTRANPEQCCLGTRGHPKRANADVPKLIISPRRRHSQKPDETYDRIERLCSGPYIELFARQKHPGWDAWGDEVENRPGERRWDSRKSPIKPRNFNL